MMIVKIIIFLILIYVMACVLYYVMHKIFYSGEIIPNKKVKQ